MAPRKIAVTRSMPDSPVLRQRERCRRALAANRLLEVILRKGDRALDISDEVYIGHRYYAVWVSYVGGEATGDPGTIKGEFLTLSLLARMQTLDRASVLLPEG
jgi:hypothetical protein